MNGAADTSTAFSVVIPSHRRPLLLQRCLDALTPSMGARDEAVVVLRADDAESWTVVDQLRQNGAPRTVRGVVVEEQGFWPALMTGLVEAGNDFVAFLDDDAIPMPGWLDALRNGFRDPTVGGYGGPILNFDGVRTANSFYSSGPIAHVNRRGVPRSKLHGWPAGPLVEDVDFLPGSNMAYRKHLLSKVRSLSLPGMAPSNELVLAAAIQSQGYRVVFDSNVKVEHHPGPRPDYGRNDDTLYAFSYAYTMTIALNSYSLFARVCNALLGSRVAPGLLAGPLCAVKGRRLIRRWWASRRGRAMANRELRAARSKRMTRPSWNLVAASIDDPTPRLSHLLRTRPWRGRV